MKTTIIFILAAIATVKAGSLSDEEISVEAPVAIEQPVLTKSDNEYDPHPQYSFAYDIHDGISGDSKSQVESRDGDIVRGQYSLNDPDGYKRTVDYFADSVNGFNAIVRREPIDVPIIKSYAAAPTVIKSQPTLIRSEPVLIRNQPIVIKNQPLLVRGQPLPVSRVSSLTVPYPSASIFGQRVLATPLQLSSPALIKSTPLSVAPNFLRSVPLTYSSQPVLSVPYAAGPTLIKTSHV